ncbi:FkbM family methyltransferase [Mesorhizobium sp. 1M-11]|uniref:FkbM family methyltransferase n=1 Tax=Mesorhizobium sp. 1M-11 TaxID=1529006 RepID=UPI000ACE962F|nr:FkbM family methyltransferase [Mesorhizobium sp. 1M-11]
MKPRDVFAALGFRKGPKTYGYTIKEFELVNRELVQFAVWLHPKCSAPDISLGAIDELRKYLSPGDAVIDIGAHVGDTSVLYALAVGPGGKVFAVEPNRYLWPVLEANALLNPQAAPIEIMHFAATEQPTKLVFNYSDPGYCNGGDLDRFGRLAHGHMYPLEVEGRNVLAELRATSPDWLSRIRLIKTDAEGNDHAVLETMRELIVSVRPFILCEVYKRTSIEQRTAFLDFLNELGYDCHRSWSCAELKGQLLNAADMERWPHFDMFCVPR